MSFEVGAVVTLKSGGVPMTVANVHNDLGMVDCVWLHDGEYRTSRFPLAVLKVADPPSSRQWTQSDMNLDGTERQVATKKIKGV